MLRLTITTLLAVACAAPILAQRGGSAVAGRAYEGEELAADLPGREHIKNIGSRLDGAGMCVFSSVEMAARWQGLESFRGWRDWCAQNYRGGGYPSKVDALVKVWCQKKGIAIPPYVQYEGRDPKPILELCDRTGRMACITYGYSPRYGGGTIYHMTCCPKFGGRWAVCLDNNFPGEDRYEWMMLDEMVRRVKHPGGSAWVFAWLAPAPPPCPRN